MVNEFALDLKKPHLVIWSFSVVILIAVEGITAV